MMYGAVDLPSSAIVVADPAFVLLLSFLEPEYMVSSCMQRASLLANQHQRTKDEVKCLPRAQATVGVALTNDGSTLFATQSFAMHTAHFLDREWARF